MNPNEKANDLMDKFSEVCPGLQDCKEAALIAVNEIIDFRNNIIFNEGSIAHQYWVEVKKEIKKIDK